MFTSTQVARFVKLQSYLPQPNIRDKIVRSSAPTQWSWYSHPTYVLTREKILNTLWKDGVMYELTAKPLAAGLVLAFLLKA
jgi:hypothetical protein